MDLVPPLHAADDHIGLDLRGDGFAHVPELHTVELVVFGDLEGDQLRLTVGKGGDLQGRGQRQHPGSLPAALQLGIEDHGKPQPLPQVAHILAVVGIADPGDGCAARHTLGHGAAQQVQLVGLSDGDDQVRIFDPRLLLDGIGGTVAHHAHDVVGTVDILHQSGVLVDDGDVVALPAQLLHQGDAHLAAADDDDGQTFVFLHNDLSLRRKR